jgi:hypothetical protein
MGSIINFTYLRHTGDSLLRVSGKSF